MTEKIVIAGGGPVGALLAILLAKQGLASEVYEKRAKPERTPAPDDTQAYLLNTNYRTISTFEECGFNLDALTQRSGGKIDQQFYSSKGFLQHKIEAEVSAENPIMMRVFRDEIARHVIDEAERLYPDKIKFHFEECISTIDLASKTVTISGTAGDRQVSYDLLVGADGAGSKVRDAIQIDSEPGFMRRKKHDIVYATTQGDLGDLPKHTLFFLQPFEAGAVILNARGDGDVRLALFVPKPVADQISAGDTTELQNQIQNGLDSINKEGKQALLRLLKKPGPFHPISGWTYLNRLYGPSTLLVGDAAHTMTPVLGQGCNSGIEDARLFAEALKNHPDNLDAALKAYNALRWPDIQALLSLNEIAANERRVVVERESALKHKMWINTHAVMLKTHQVLGMVLWKKFPSIFGPPTIMLALMGKVQYRKVLPAVYRDSILVATFALSVVAGLTQAGISLCSRFVQA